MRKCTLCNSGDIEDEYHVTLIYQHFKHLRTKYVKKYYYARPNMAKFIELMHLQGPHESLKVFKNMKSMKGL